MITLNGRQLENFDAHTYADVRYIVFNNNSKSYNVFDTQTIIELEYLIEDIEEGDYKVVVFSSAKDGFIVGADIKEFHTSLDDIESLVLRGQLLFNRIEDLPIPSLAIIHGSAMGGGLELALACTSRVCMENSQVALPETKLGIIPGWGGTTRLPRLIGVSHALDVICSGRNITSYEALQMGIVDRIIEDEGSIPFADLSINFNEKRRKKKGVVSTNSLKALAAFKFAKSSIVKKTEGNYPAPLKALDVISNCRKMCRNDALKYERIAFAELAKGPVAKNLIGIFFGERKLKTKATNLCKSDSKVSKVAVMGAGAMGSGIAFALANKADINVSLYDPYEEQLEKSNVSNGSYLEKKVQKGYITSRERDRILDLIYTTSIMEKAVEGADIVIEAVPENLELKSSIFQKVHTLSPDSILATNTSTFRVESLKEGVAPDKLGGLHFFNPVSKMPLVEVVRGPESSEETISQLCQVALELKKIPLVCNDCAGFVVNRILMPYLVKFDSMISNGIDFEHIDKVMKGFGWPMGPAELCDLVGMDVVYHGAQNIANEYDYITLPENSFVKKLYDDKNLGQKTRSGFYSWKKNNKKGKSTNTGGTRPHPDEVESQLMEVMTKEAERILEEGIVEKPYEINMAMVFGIGYPPYRKGII